MVVLCFQILGWTIFSGSDRDECNEFLSCSKDNCHFKILFIFSRGCCYLCFLHVVVQELVLYVLLLVACCGAEVLRVCCLKEWRKWQKSVCLPQPFPSWDGMSPLRALLCLRNNMLSYIMNGKSSSPGSFAF